jgi:hypothetical protein
MKTFDKIKDLYNLSSVWSIYEVDDIDDLANVPEDIRYMTYRNNPPLPVPANASYFDLWLLANALINLEGSHHIYIEGFSRNESPRTIELVTGS